MKKIIATLTFLVLTSGAIAQRTVDTLIFYNGGALPKDHKLWDIKTFGNRDSVKINGTMFYPGSADTTGWNLSSFVKGTPDSSCYFSSGLVPRWKSDMTRIIGSPIRVYDNNMITIFNNDTYPNWCEYDYAHPNVLEISPGFFAGPNVDGGCHYNNLYTYFQSGRPFSIYVYGGIATSGRIWSNVPTGHMPIQLYSTTKCDSLNADFVDGHHASDFSLLNHTHAGMTTGSGTLGYLTRWTGSSTLGNSICYDNGSFLGIGSTAPAANEVVRINGGTGRGLRVENASTGAGEAALSAFSTGASANNGIAIYSSAGNAAHNYSFWGNAGILYNAGQACIGVALPDSTLTVSGSGNITGNLKIGGKITWLSGNSDNANYAYAWSNPATTPYTTLSAVAAQGYITGLSAGSYSISVTGSSGSCTGNSTGLTISASPSSDHTVKGSTISLTAAANSAIGDIGYINSSGKVSLCKADAIANCPVVFCICADASISANASGNWMTEGVIRDDSWNWTVGGSSGIIYASTTGTTGNTLTQTPPSGANNVVIPVGMALTSHIMYFKQNFTSVEHL